MLDFQEEICHVLWQKQQIEQGTFESHQELAGGTSFQWLLGVTTTLANRVKHLHSSDWCVIVRHVKDNTDNKEMSILAVRCNKTLLTHVVNLTFTTHVSCAGCLGCQCSFGFRIDM